jgi:hypothetical protein
LPDFFPSSINAHPSPIATLQLHPHQPNHLTHPTLQKHIQDDWRQIWWQGLWLKEHCSIVSSTSTRLSGVVFWFLQESSISFVQTRLLKQLPINTNYDTAVPQRLVSHSQSDVSIVFSERATMLSVLVLVSLHETTSAFASR